MLDTPSENYRRDVAVEAVQAAARGLVAAATAFLAPATSNHDAIAQTARAFLSEELDPTTATRS